VNELPTHADRLWRLCGLVCMQDLVRLHRVHSALASRGIDALPADRSVCPWRAARGFGPPRILVRPRDLMYARRVVYAAGVDTWPGDPSEHERPQA
jgi:hypothetical protein